MFDTVILVRALINPHGVWGRLIFQYAHAYTLVVSPPIVAEMLDVLHRPELTRRFRSLLGLAVARAIEILDSAEAVEIEDVPAVSRDVPLVKVWTGVSTTLLFRSICRFTTYHRSIRRS